MASIYLTSGMAEVPRCSASAAAMAAVKSIITAKEWVSRPEQIAAVGREMVQGVRSGESWG